MPTCPMTTATKKIATTSCTKVAPVRHDRRPVVRPVHHRPVISITIITPPVMAAFSF